MLNTKSLMVFFIKKIIILIYVSTAIDVASTFIEDEGS